MAAGPLPAFEGYLCLLEHHAGSLANSSSSSPCSSFSSRGQWKTRWCTLLNGVLHVYHDRRAAVEHPYDVLRTIDLSPFQQLKVSGDYDTGGLETWDLTLVGDAVPSINIAPPAFEHAAGTPTTSAKTLPKSATSGSLSAMFARMGGSSSLRTEEQQSARAASPFESAHASSDASHNGHSAPWSKLTARSKRLYKLVASGLPGSPNHSAELQAQARSSPSPSAGSSLTWDRWGSTSNSSVSPCISQQEHTQLSLTLRTPDATSMVRWAEALSACLYRNDQANRPASFAASPSSSTPYHARSRRTPLSQVNDAFAAVYGTANGEESSTSSSDDAASVMHAGMTSRRRRQGSGSFANEPVQSTDSIPPQPSDQHRPSSPSSDSVAAKTRRRASLELFHKLGGGSRIRDANAEPSTTEVDDQTARNSIASASSASTTRHELSAYNFLSSHIATRPSSAASQIEVLRSGEEATSPIPPALPALTSLTSPSTSYAPGRKAHYSRRSMSSGQICGSGSSSAQTTNHDDSHGSSSLLHSGDGVEPSPWTSTTTCSSYPSPSPHSPLSLFGGLRSSNDRPCDETSRTDSTDLLKSNAVRMISPAGQSSRSSGESSNSLSSRGPLGLGLDLGGRRRISQSASANLLRAAKSTEASNTASMQRCASLIGLEHQTIVESPSYEDAITTLQKKKPGTYQPTTEGAINFVDVAQTQMSTQNTPTPEREATLGPMISTSSTKLFSFSRRASMHRLTSSPSMPSLKADLRREQNGEQQHSSLRAANHGTSPIKSMASPRSKLQGARQMLFATAKWRAPPSRSPKEADYISNASHDDLGGASGGPDSPISLHSELSASSPQLFGKHALPTDWRDSTSTRATIASPPMIERILPPEEIIATIDRLRNERLDAARGLDLAGAGAPAQAVKRLRGQKMHRPSTSPAFENAGSPSPTFSLSGHSAGSTVTGTTGKPGDEVFALTTPSADTTSAPSQRLRSLPVPPRMSKRSRSFLNTAGSPSDQRPRTPSPLMCEAQLPSPIATPSHGSAAAGQCQVGTAPDSFHGQSASQTKKTRAIDFVPALDVESDDDGDDDDDGDKENMENFFRHSQRSSLSSARGGKMMPSSVSTSLGIRRNKSNAAIGQETRKSISESFTHALATQNRTVTLE